MSTGFVGPNGLRKGCKDNVNFEARWAMAAKAGYTLAFEELVTRNEDRIYRLALNITQNQQDAEDLLQDTFIEAQEHLQEFRGGSRFSAWLVQICIQKALQKFGERDLSGVGLDEPMESESDFMSNKVTDWGDCPEQRYTKTQLNRILSEAISKLKLSAPDRVSAARRRELLDCGDRGFARTLRFGNKVASTPSTPRCA